MKDLLIESAFRRDTKICRKRGTDLGRIDAMIEILRNGHSQPPNYRPHKLQGKWRGAWECHVAPDLLLVYEFDETTVTLIRLGSHSDLF